MLYLTNFVMIMVNQSTNDVNLFRIQIYMHMRITTVSVILRTCYLPGHSVSQKSEILISPFQTAQRSFLLFCVPTACKMFWHGHQRFDQLELLTRVFLTLQTNKQTHTQQHKRVNWTAQNNSGRTRFPLLPFWQVNTHITLSTCKVDIYNP